MGQLILPEQDIINAVCVYTAAKKQLNPEDIEVELMYDDDTGFSAEVHANGRKQILVKANLIEAIRMWLDVYLKMDPFSPGIELILDDREGIIAKVMDD